jgi:hypothetical protein
MTYFICVLDADCGSGEYAKELAVKYHYFWICAYKIKLKLKQSINGR